MKKVGEGWKEKESKEEGIMKKEETHRTKEKLME